MRWGDFFFLLVGGGGGGGGEGTFLLEASKYVFPCKT